MSMVTFINILTGFFESIIIFMIFNTFCTKRDNIPMVVYVLGRIVLAVLIDTSNFFFSFYMMNTVMIVCSIFAVSFLYVGGIMRKAVISIMSYLLIVIAEVIVLFLISFLGRVTVSEVVHDEQFRLLGIIFSKLLLFIIAKAICLKSKKIQPYMNMTYWGVFLLIFGNSILAVFLIFKLSYDNTTTYMYNLSVICSFGLLFSTFFALYMYERMAEQTEIINRQKLYEQQMSVQTNHLAEIVEAQKQFRKTRHDFINHLISLKAYFEDNDYKNGIEYIGEISESVKENILSVDTGNVALDAIISSKKTVANANNIRFDESIQIPEKLQIDATDICIIFGNALDNAIEACEKVDAERRYINLSLVYQTDRLICKIANGCPEDTKPDLSTTKSDLLNHGYGLENIRTALEKYRSVIDITIKENEFILSFIIFD